MEGIEFETRGGWDSSAIKVISKLAGQLARHSGKEDSEIIRHTFQWLSILLMRGNASLLLSRAPYPSLNMLTVFGTVDVFLFYILINYIQTQ